MKTFIIALTIIYATPLMSIYAENFDPWEWDRIKSLEDVHTNRYINSYEGGDPLIISFLSFIRFYQIFISPRLKQRCPCYPSCSRFSYESISRYGIWGVFMMIDRLFYRENNEMHNFNKLIKIDDRYRFYDPPENNYIFDKSKWRLIK